MGMNILNDKRAESPGFVELEHEGIAGEDDLIERRGITYEEGPYDAERHYSRPPCKEDKRYKLKGA